MRAYLIGSVVGLFSLGVASARGVVTYTNFGAGHSYNASVQYLSFQFESPAEFGFGFVPSVSGGVTEIRTAAFTLSGSRNLTFTLYSAAAGGGVGTQIGSWAGLVSSGSTPTSLVLDGSTHIEAGTQYYLTLRDPASLDWRWNIAGAMPNPLTGEQIYRNTNGSWGSEIEPIAAFELSVPSPGALGALGTPLGLFAINRRRRVKR